MNIMGWPAVVLSGREVGVAEWALSCVLLGGGRVGSCGVGWRGGSVGGQGEWPTREYYGTAATLGRGMQWMGECKDSSAYGIEAVG